MKKRSILMSLLLLLPFFSSPLSVYSQETTVEPQAVLQEEMPPLVQPIPSTLASEKQAIDSPLNIFNHLSLSEYASALSGGATLGASFLETAAAPFIIPVMLGASIAYSSYQLGSYLGVMTNDLIQTSKGLRESLGSTSNVQQDLTDFALSGMNSTTSTYNFSQNLQARYAQDVTSHAVMREYLTGTNDHGAYRFSISSDALMYRRRISYNLLWSEQGQACILGRDASVAKHTYADDQFFVLESIELAEPSRASDQAILEIVGKFYIANGASQAFLYTKELPISMTQALEQITTLDGLLGYVQQTTTYTLGAIDVPSTAVAVETAQAMANEYTTRKAQITNRLTEALAPTNNGIDFDPSGMIASLYGQAVVLDQAGNFIYAETKQAVPTYYWDAIEISYSADAIPYDDALTIDGRRGVLDEETGDIIDGKTKDVLIKGALGATWTATSMALLKERIKELKEKDPNNKDDDEKFSWYTPIDLVYDEFFAKGGKGHTIMRHIGKTEKELQQRLEGSTFLLHASTFYDPVQALIAINAGIYTANQRYLDGKIKAPLGECSFDSTKNRIEYDSDQLWSFGWGLYEIRKYEYKYYDSITYTKVIIQKTNQEIRKKRHYYIVTAFPDLKRYKKETNTLLYE